MRQNQRVCPGHASKSKNLHRSGIQIKVFAPVMHSNQGVCPVHAFKSSSLPLSCIQIKEFASVIHHNERAGKASRSSSWPRPHICTSVWVTDCGHIQRDRSSLTEAKTHDQHNEAGVDQPNESAAVDQINDAHHPGFRHGL